MEYEMRRSDARFTVPLRSQKITFNVPVLSLSSPFSMVSLFLWDLFLYLFIVTLVATNECETQQFKIVTKQLNNKHRSTVRSAAHICTHNKTLQMIITLLANGNVVIENWLESDFNICFLYTWVNSKERTKCNAYTKQHKWHQRSPVQYFGLVFFFSTKSRSILLNFTDQQPFAGKNVALQQAHLIAHIEISEVNNSFQSNAVAKDFRPILDTWICLFGETV